MTRRTYRRQTTLCTYVHSPVDTEGTDCLPRTLEYTRGAAKATTRRHNYHRRLGIAVVSYYPPSSLYLLLFCSCPRTLPSISACDCWQGGMFILIHPSFPAIDETPMPSSPALQGPSVQGRTVHNRHFTPPDAHTQGCMCNATDDTTSLRNIVMQRMCTPN